MAIPLSTHRAPGLRTFRPGAAELIRFELTTGIEMQRFLRQANGEFFPNLQRNIYEAHYDIGSAVVQQAYNVLVEKMKAHSPQRPGREAGKLRRVLRGALREQAGRPPFEVLNNGRGVIVDFDKELNDLVRDERGRPYWRAVNDGFVRTAVGHLFFNNGRYYAPRAYTARGFEAIGGADPRMPKLKSLEHTFTYRFEGYFFAQEGVRRARILINKRGAENYLWHMQFPTEMLRVMEFYGAGNKGKFKAYGPNPRSASGVSPLRDPRKHTTM